MSQNLDCFTKNDNFMLNKTNAPAMKLKIMELNIYLKNTFKMKMKDEQFIQVML